MVAALFCRFLTLGGVMSKTKKVLVGFGVALLAPIVSIGLHVLANYATGGHPTLTSTRTVPATPSTRAVTATPSVSRPALSQAQQHLECGALAMVRMGYGTYAQQVQTVARQYDVPRHEAAALIARAVREACPAEKGILP